jgi:molecular chaperone DnaJ
MSDLYRVLGVDHNADARTIREAYRRLARRHHPDAGGEQARMIEINEAWHVLSAPERKASYDAQIARPKVKAPRSRDGRTVLDFGRYEGWSLGEIAAQDDDYLEWLSRTPMGRPLRREISEVLADRAVAMEALRPAVAVATKRRRWGRG